MDTERQVSTAPKSSINPLIWLGGIAGAIGAILGVVFLLIPSLKPQPPPSVLSGKITEIVWQQPYSGSVHYFVNSEIIGYNGQTCRLAYSVYTSAGQYAGIANTDAVNLQPQSNDDTGGATIAVTDPAQAGTYYVIITLYAPNGSKLDTRTSPLFNIY